MLPRVCRIIVCGVMLSFLTACQSVAFFIANTPSFFSSQTRVSDVAYGEAAHQTLDIYLPTKDTKDAPVIVFFYGGGWTDGEKAQYRFVADRFTRKGYVVVIPDYIKYPDAGFPVFIEDGAKAVAWTLTHIGAYGGNPKQVVLMGHSAGAHMGGMLITDRHYLKDAGASVSAIRGFVGLAGPYAFTPEEEIYKQVFAPPSNYPRMQMPTFIDGTEPPMLLLYGEDDDVVYYSNIEKVTAASKAKGGSVISKGYAGLGHIGMVGVLSAYWSDKAPVAEDADQFIRSALKE